MSAEQKPDDADTFAYPALYRNLTEKAFLEQRNGLRQFEDVLELVREWQGVLRLTPDVIQNLHAAAIDELYICAGEFRSGPVGITGSHHTPPPHEEVPGFVAEMCEYANENASREPLETAAYLMWRVNWIHPFFGGNGRTSRAVSYLGLSVGLKMELPGRLTIPDQIVADRNRYYDALELAHEAWRERRLALSPLISLLDTFLRRQLAS